MRRVSIPYDRTVLEAEIDERNFLGCFESALPAAAADQATAVREALDRPSAPRSSRSSPQAGVRP